MSDLDRHVQDYLALRRGLGFKLIFHGRVLPQFVAYLDAAGASTITVALAIEWAGLPQGVLPISKAHRLGAVRGFARYLQTIEPATEVPPCGIWSSTTPRRTPYSWSDDDIVALLTAAAQLEPSLRATTYETLFGLLAASGMRIGEALGLDRDDVDLADGVITVRDGKFARSRHVPLHPSTTAALTAHAVRRDRLCPKPSSTTFFLTSVGTALSYNGVWRTFRALTTAIGLRTSVRPVRSCWPAAPG